MCDLTFVGMCISPVPADDGQTIFGFSEFLAAFALLVLVFNQSDAVYKFRVLIAPFNLYKATFWTSLFIGLGSLLTDVWFSQRWYSFEWGVTHAQIQAVFALLFLATVFIWLWFGFIRPATFSPWNYRNFYNSLYWWIKRGSESQLPVAAAEILNSAKAIVKYGIDLPRYDETARIKPRKHIEGVAHEILILMGNRKFCRFVVSHTPITAIEFMREASQQKKYSLPLSQFAKNVFAEAILNPDSPLYNEDDDWRAGIAGHSKPFSFALFGDARLIEGLEASGGSPFNFDWRMKEGLTPRQFEAFQKAVLMTYESYLDTGLYRNYARGLRGALEVIKSAGSKLNHLDKLESIPYPNNELDKYKLAIDFVKDAIKLIETRPNITFSNSRRDQYGHIVNRNALDDLADIMFELFFDASYVKSNADSAHWVQHNTFWGEFFSFSSNTPTWKILRSKFFRLIYDEIKRMEEMPNYKGAAVLGLCLNVLGVSPPQRRDYRRNVYALHKVVLDWTQRNYLAILKTYPLVGRACMIGGISFDEKNKRIVKTYAQALHEKPSQRFLNLSVPKRKTTRNTSATGTR